MTTICDNIIDIIMCEPHYVKLFFFLKISVCVGLTRIVLRHGYATVPIRKYLSFLLTRVMSNLTNWTGLISPGVHKYNGYRSCRIDSQLHFTFKHK